MNRTHLEHALIALGVQLILWPLLGVVAAGIVACAVFFGREVAQHEYKALRLQYHEALTLGELPWWVGLRYGWTRDSVLDVVTPAVLCALLAVAITALGAL